MHRVESEESIGEAERENRGRDGDVEAVPGHGDGGQVVRPPAAPRHPPALEAGELEERQPRGHGAHGTRRLEAEDPGAGILGEAGSGVPDLDLLRGVVSEVGGLPGGGGGGGAGQGEQEPGGEAEGAGHAQAPDTLLLTQLPVML